MFTFEEYVWEIQKGLLLIADHIHRMRGDEVAESFIGFRYSGSYTDEAVEKVDLRNFGPGLAWLLMYDFAFGLESSLEPSGDFEETALEAFLRLVPITDAYGDAVGWPADPLTQRVLDAFRARRKLTEPEEFPSATFSVRELALLADMKEGAVRNAMSSGELPSRRADGKVVVDWAAAAEWFPKKRGFRSPGENAADLVVERATSLSGLIAGLSPLVPDEVIPASWRAGAWDGDLSGLLPLADAARVDPELLSVRMTQLWVREHRQTPLDNS